jgi:hypothetical protein
VTAATAPSPSEAVASAQVSAESQVRAQETERVAALLDGDGVRYARLADHRLVVTHSTGRREDRSAFVGALEGGQLRYQRLEQQIDAVVVHGRSAVVSARMDAELHAGGALRSVQALSTAVWLRKGRRWRLLAFHTTAAERPQPPLATVSAV